VPVGHRPALDVLRVIALVLVMAGHLRSAYLEAGGSDSFFLSLPLLRRGWMGADLFFVLSGYLIGRLLFTELAARGRLGSVRFQFRRVLRVSPLYLAAAVAAAYWPAAPAATPTRPWVDFLFVSNYVSGGTLEGAWSICLEEQFYLLAPLLALVLGTAQAGRSPRAHLGAVALMAVFPVMRAWTWFRLTGGLTVHDAELFVRHLIHPLHLHGDGVVMGLLLAQGEMPVPGASSSQAARFDHWRRWRTILMGTMLAAALIVIQREVFTFTAVSIVCGSLVWTILSSARPASRPLWWGAVAFAMLGRLSFGMYLNHRYVLERVTGPLLRAHPLAQRFPGAHALVVFTIATLLSMAIATQTFLLIEYPFLWLRRWVVPRLESAGSGNGS
jgi:peptidoglycan/LPS O-acetylase OafA/YrhL